MNKLMDYPFSSIWVNGRFETLDAIVRETTEARSPFEVHTFKFIREWLSGQQHFSLQTSGTTGTPKLITIKRQQMIDSAWLTAKALGLERLTNALVCIDTAYIGGKMMLVRSFVIGMRIWAVDPTARPLQKIPVDQCVNFAAFVPFQVQNMLGSKHPHLLNNVDKVIIGGAPLVESLITKLKTLLCVCYATYGMTETISHIALRTLNGPHAQPFFEALPGIKLQSDDRGCLLVDAPFLPDQIITNDLVELSGFNHFRWLGRWDNIINTGGVKVMPEKVEAAIEKIFLSAGLSNRYFIHGADDTSFGQKVVMVIEGSDSSDITNKILPELRRVLSPYEIPKEVWISPSFVFTASGKVNRLKTLEGVTHSFRLKK